MPWLGSQSFSGVSCLHRQCAHLFDGWDPWNSENEKEIGDAHQ